MVAEVELRVDQLWNVMQNPDFDQMMTLFHESPDLSSAHDGGFVSGSATAEGLRPVIDEWEDQVLTVSETRTLVLSPISPSLLLLRKVLLDCGAKESRANLLIESSVR